MSTRYNTGNTIESTDVRDMSDNAKNFDDFANSKSNEFTDRFGVERKTIHGMNSQFDSQILNMGFTRVGTFAAGETLTNPRQTLLWAIADGGDGQEYGWSGSFIPSGKVVPPLSTPNTTGGISVGAWISRFDPELSIAVREALRRSYAEAGFNLVAGSFEDGGEVTSIDDVLLYELQGLAYRWDGEITAGGKVVPAGSTPEPQGPGGWVSVGDAALRSALSGTLSSSTGASMVKGAFRVVPDISGLFNLPGKNEGDLITTGSYLIGAKVGGTTYRWNPGRPRSDHNGVTAISPTAPHGGVLASLPSFYNGVGEIEPGSSGCWDLLCAEVDAYFAGCQPGNIDNAIPLAKFLDLCGTIPRRAKLSGFITTSQPVDLSYPNLVLHGIGWRLSGFKVTAPGVAAFAKGTRPNNNAFSLGQELADFTIEGNAEATILFQYRLNHSTVRNVNLREASPNAVGWSIEGSVLTNFENISCSTNIQAMVNRPLYGIILKADPDDPEGPRRASANTFIRPLIEGMRGDGIVVQASDQNTFIGGTSEGNEGIGISVSSGCRANTFKGVGLENSGGDIFDDGQMNAFENCYGTRELIVGANSQFHRTYGGYFNSVSVHASASFSTIESIQYNWLQGSPGTFNNNNNLTLSTRNLRNVNGGFYFFPKKTPVIVTVGPSPFTYFNNSGKAEHVYVSSGTITFQREGVDYYQVSPATMISLLPGDGVKVAWTGTAPFMSRIPFGSVII